MYLFQFYFCNCIECCYVYFIYPTCTPVFFNSFPRQLKVGKVVNLINK
jgi:hypothetical protein